MTAAIAPSTFSALPLAEGSALLNLLIVDDERAVREACREAATALGFVAVLLIESVFGRTMSRRARVVAIIVGGTVLFALSFGGMLVFRRRQIGVCA